MEIRLEARPRPDAHRRPARAVDSQEWLYRATTRARL